MNADAFRQMDADTFRPPRWLRWAAVAVVAGGIFYTSLISSPSSGLPSLGPFGVFRIDKWLHALAYAGLAGTLAVALASGRRLAVVAALAILLATGYGVGIEFAQAPLPERYFSFADMAANATGAISGVLGWWVGLGFAGQLGAKEQSESGA